MEYNSQNFKVDNIEEKVFGYPFLLVLIYLFIEYGRPQSYFSFLRILHPGMILSILLFITLILKGNIYYLKLRQSIYFLLLIVLMTIHVPIASNNFHAFETWRATVLLFIVFLSIINFVNSYQRLVIYIDTWILINIFGAIIGILNKGVIPNSGFMEDENDFSLVMNMAIPFAYFMFLEAETKIKKILYLICIGIFTIGCVISLSRGGFIGLIFIFFYCWLKTPRKIYSTIFILLMAGILIIAAPSSYWDEVKSIKEQNIESGTGATRWYYWQTGWDMFLDNPILGVGQDNYPWNVEQYGGEGYGGRLHGGRVAHSIYFTLIPELGILGTITFLLMVFYFRRTNKYIIFLQKNLYQYGLEVEEFNEKAVQINKIKFISFAIYGALFGYLVSGIFLSVLYYPHFWLLCALPVAIKNISNDLEYSMEDINHH
jgi:O-antigen ligase